MQFGAKSNSHPEFYGTLEQPGGAVEQIKKLAKEFQNVNKIFWQWKKLNHLTTEKC